MHISALRPVNYIDLALIILGYGNFCAVPDQLHDLGGQHEADL